MALRTVFTQLRLADSVLLALLLAAALPTAAHAFTWEEVSYGNPTVNGFASGIAAVNRGSDLYLYGSAILYHDYNPTMVLACRRYWLEDEAGSEDDEFKTLHSEIEYTGFEYELPGFEVSASEARCRLAGVLVKGEIWLLELQAAQDDTLHLVRHDGHDANTHQIVTGPFPTDYGITATVLNDSIYLFYADRNANNNVFLRTITFGDTAAGQDPTQFYVSEAIQIGDVPATGDLGSCSWVDSEGEEHVMVAWPDAVDVTNINRLHLFSGRGTDFSLWSIRPCAPYDDGGNGNNIIQAPSLIASPVHGGVEGNFLQVYYVDADDNEDLIRMEVNLDTGVWGGYARVRENMNCWGTDLVPITAASMYYQVSGERMDRQVAPILVTYNGQGPDLHMARYNATHLEYARTLTSSMEDIPRSMGQLIAVVEGAPPYTLNGNPFNSEVPPSAFEWQHTESDVTTVNTTTKTSVKMGAGVGPATVAYSAAFTQSNSITDSYTTTVNLSTTPADPAVYPHGAMHSIYIMPSLERREWSEHYHLSGNATGDTLLFFSFTDPFQIQVVSEPLENFSRSPHARNLESYVGRGLNNSDTLDAYGIEVLGSVQASDNNQTGITINGSIGISSGQTSEQSTSETITVGGSSSYGFFSITAQANWTFGYGTSTSTEMTDVYSFWVDVPPPSEDATHWVNGYSITGYVTQCVSGDSYFLPPEAEKARPLFVTYQVSSLDLPVEDKPGSILPQKMSLAAYPNPFNESATLHWTLPQSGQVQLGVYDLLGRHVGDLASGVHRAGLHRSSWDASELPSGVYLIRLQSGTEQQLRKVVLLK